MKAEIARAFVDAHKNSSLEEWQPMNVFDEEEKLNTIYNNMVNDVYGECRQEDGEYQIEIDRFDSITGAPQIFTWSDA